MKRGRPLKRTTPLTVKKPMQRAGKLAAPRGATLRAKAKRNSKQLPPVPNTVRVELYNLNDEHCPHCGNWFALAGAHVHHRKKRTQGGGNDPANLILCPPACHEDIHSNPARSYELGHMVRRGDDPEAVRIREVTPGWAVAS